MQLPQPSSPKKAGVFQTPQGIKCVLSAHGHFCSGSYPEPKQMQGAGLGAVRAPVFPEAIQDCLEPQLWGLRLPLRCCWNITGNMNSWGPGGAFWTLTPPPLAHLEGGRLNERSGGDPGSAWVRGTYRMGFLIKTNATPMCLSCCGQTGGF